MNIDEMWELYDKTKGLDIHSDIEDLLMSIEDIYEQGLIDGMDLVKKQYMGEYFIYYISDGFYVKIGVSNNIQRRLKQIQTSHPAKLEVIHIEPYQDKKSAYLREKELHEKYSSIRVSGEWFLKDEIIKNFILLGGLNENRNF